VAAGVALGLAAGAFAFGAALGDGGAPAPDAVSRLAPAQLAGQRLVAGFDGPSAPRPLRRMIRAGRLAGVILFSDNLPGRSAARRLVRRLQAIPRPPGLRQPLLVMVDQEGGLVKRLAGPPSASAREMGLRGGRFSREQGRGTARSVRGVGVNVDLAPVLDVARPAGTIADTDRGFGATPAAVAESAVPFASGLRAGGTAATGKHFPGLGAAPGNTDFAAQRIGLTKPELRRIDEAPYRPFIAAGGDLVMLSTAIYPAFGTRPAAFTRAIATGELRGRLGFEGVSITDALDSVAVRDFAGPGGAALAGARAGADLLLYTDPDSALRAHRALLAELRREDSARAGFEASARRVLRLRQRLGR
jgi:beta-N-acetylhexosaminidase